MSKYILRLDDACEKRDVIKWDKMEALLDKYSIQPLVGIIPCCEDENFSGYSEDIFFWKKVAEWKKKNWTIAIHGCTHKFESKSGGINPVNNYSEFAGVPLERQKDKMATAIKIFRQHGINPKVFFAPAHTFDENTLISLKQCTDVRIISDMVANDVYYEKGFYFVPQQSGRVRNLPFSVVTFCYHPNNMTESDFYILEEFLKKKSEKFISFADIKLKKRKKNLFDELLNRLYFVRR